jgi:putative heme-binding domain-containing protein
MTAVKKLLLLRDEPINALVKKHWGDVKGATTAQMEQDIARFGKIVSSGAGNPYAGKKLFRERCYNCHVLHSEGASVGPDLTPYKRDDTAQLLLHIVNPSAEIREGYEQHLVFTDSGRSVAGVLVEKDARVVVLKTADGQKVTLRRDEVADESVLGVSLMPEALLANLSDQQVRDLFAYLRSTQPLFDAQ